MPTCPVIVRVRDSVVADLMLSALMLTDLIWMVCGWSSSDKSSSVAMMQSV